MERTGTTTVIVDDVRKRRKVGIVRGLLRFSRQKPLGAAGGALIIFMLLMALLAGIVSPFDPIEMRVDERLTAPNTQYLFGTDEYGRDVLTRIIHGSRISLYVGFFSVALSTGIGTVLGLLSGYLSGKVDIVLQRVMDAIMAFPSLLLALAIMAALGSSLNNVVLAIAITNIPRVSRLVRGSVLSAAQNQYIEAARAIGCGGIRISLVHLLPNVLAPIIVIATANLGGAILTEATLSFLGLGVPPPAPSWGGMVSGSAQKYLEQAPWLAFFPGMAISLGVMGFNLWGDAIRDVWDPRLRGAGLRKA